MDGGHKPVALEAGGASEQSNPIDGQPPPAHPEATRSIACTHPPATTLRRPRLSSRWPCRAACPGWWWSWPRRHRRRLLLLLVLGSTSSHRPRMEDGARPMSLLAVPILPDCLGIERVVCQCSCVARVVSRNGIARKTHESYVTDERRDPLGVLLKQIETTFGTDVLR